MKKIGIMFLLFSMVSFVGCKNNDKIVVAEVAHTAFYAPQYVALEKGFFLEEGLDVSLILTNGADKTMAALLSKDADIGLMGPEASIYVYNNGQENYAINFAQLTKRDGNFIVARENYQDFSVEDFKQKEILGGRKGGMPEMVLEYALKTAGLSVGQNDTTKDVNVRTDVQFAALAGAFAQGEGDFVTLFEPTATLMQKEGKGYIVASLGEIAGDIPYTCYSALKNYIKSNENKIMKFTKAIYKAQKWVIEHTALEIAEAIKPQFTDLSLDDLETVVDRYKEAGVYSLNPYLREESFNKLMSIMELANELDKRAPYDKIVNTYFTNKVIKN